MVSIRFKKKNFLNSLLFACSVRWGAMCDRVVGVRDRDFRACFIRPLDMDTETAAHGNSKLLLQLTNLIKSGEKSQWIGFKRNGNEHL